MTSAAIPIHPVRTEQDHLRAIERIQSLIHAASGTPEGDELDMLATLVDAYESKHHAIDAPDPIAAIQFRMDQQGLTRKDLEAFIGSRARVSEILTRRRSLTLNMIRQIRAGLGISADLLIGSTPIQTSAKSATQRSRRASPRAKPNGTKRGHDRQSA